MNAPSFLRYPSPSVQPDFDARLAALIDSHTKTLVIDAYSFGLCTEEMAIQLIRENGLVHA